MNRRDFLKAIAAVPAATLVPSWVNPLPQWGTSIAWMMRAEQAVLNSAWAAVLHPSTWFDLRRLIARDMWRSQYRHWRVGRRELGITEPLEAVMARVKASAEADDVMDMREGLDHAFRHGQVGYYSNVRFVVTDKVA